MGRLQNEVQNKMLKFVVIYLILAAAVIWKAFHKNRFVIAVVDLFTLLLNAQYHAFSHGKGQFSMVDIFERKVDENPGKVQLLLAETGEKTTLIEMERLANQVGNWSLQNGITQNSTVCLMLLNHPDFVTIWLGIGKIGAATALINTNTTGKALLHACEVSMKNSPSKILIVDSELQSNLSNDMKMLRDAGILVFVWNGDGDNLKKQVSLQSNSRVPRSKRSSIKERDPLLYIFTSGTTGLPKACKISQSRFYMSGIMFKVLGHLTASDNIYTVLPLYHSAGGMIGISAALHSSACLVLRKKFSASNFTADCLKYRITAFQYIGELCRYLVAIPDNPKDKTLAIRVALGNGLRPECWTKFKDRYGIQHIVEFYAATEGNVGLMNGCDQVGALGFIPRIFDALYPLKIIKTDPLDQSLPLRDERGFCINCEAGEVGLLINRIPKGDKIAGRFDGYTDDKATSAKVLRDVFAKGDSYFNTGDLLYRDAAGFYYWSDRIGDTFRWKGENVATTEVTAAVSLSSHVKDVTVYGVSIPGCEGRAGMAVCAVEVKDAAVAGNEAALHDHLHVMAQGIHGVCKSNLPPYARPLFLRFKVNKSLDTTGTFKHVKADLVKEGFDPTQVKGDPLYYLNAAKDRYDVLTPDVFQQISVGKIRY